MIFNFHPSRARNATIIISRLNNFAEVLAVRVHVDVYMATTVLRSVTHNFLCDTTTTTYHLPTNPPPPNLTTLNHLYLFFLRLRRKKIIDGKNKNLNFKKPCFLRGLSRLSQLSRWDLLVSIKSRMLGPLVGSFTTCVRKLTSRNVMSL